MLKVCELRAWTEDGDDIFSQAVTTTPSTNLGICQLEECQVGQFFDLVCQVNITDEKLIFFCQRHI